MSEPKIVSIPEDIAPAIQNIFPTLQNELSTLGDEIGKKDIQITQADVQGFIPGALKALGLYLGGKVVDEITKKWVSEILWPIIKPLLKDYTEEVVEDVKAYLMSLPDRDN